MRELIDFTAELLSHTGSVVEKSDGGLEVLCPAEVANILEIPEHAKLSFSGDSGEGVLASFESDIFKNMARLLSDQGKFCWMCIPSKPVSLEKLESRVYENTVLSNAVFRLQEWKEKAVSYLLSYCKYTAVSDERQEGIIACVINESNLSARKLLLPIWDFLELEAAVPETPKDTDRLGTNIVLPALFKAQKEMVREDIQDFIKSLERRMNRDIQRVQDYYDTLVSETQQFMERKAASAEEQEKGKFKCDAIKIEKTRKVQDIMDKYRLQIHIEPISFIRVETLTPVVCLLIKRRKGERSFSLAYNPFLKTLDSLTCEKCFYPTNIYMICDDNLHILCKSCFSTCSQCAKDFCSLCQPKGCPRCKGKP